MYRLKSDKNFVDKAWDLQYRIEARQQRIGKGKYGRVLKMARKPTHEEYIKTIQITGIGILLVGLLGFLIFLAWEELPGLVKNWLNL